MKVRGYFVTHTDVEITPNEAYAALRRSLLLAAGISDQTVHLSEDKSNLLVTHRYGGHSSWAEDEVLRPATEQDRHLLSTLDSLHALMYDLRDKLK